MLKMLRLFLPSLFARELFVTYFVSWIPAIATIGSAIIGSNASSSAAQQAQQGSANASAAQLGMFNTVQGQTSPYSAQGTTAINQLGAMTAPGGSMVTPFTNTDLNANLAPNYQFQLNQGLGQTNNAANLQTGLVSGNAMMAGNKFAQDYAGGAYQNAFNNFNTSQGNIYNRLSGIANQGIQANQTLAGSATGAANGISSAATNAGNAAAAGTMGSANSISNGLMGLGGLAYMSSVANAGQPVVAH